MKATAIVRRYAPGYTLMEIMLVLLIIGMLLGAGVYMMKDAGAAGEKMKAKADIKMLETALTSYRTNALVYPSQQQGLEALVKRPTTEPIPRSYDPIVKPEALIDPWGRHYQYRIPGKNNPNSFDVFTFGRDGVEGTEDDIGNW
jgi:general secretion pathway protein G